MTKLEKIREILREYENGADSSVDTSVILSGITNVLNDPIFTEHETDKMRGCDIMRKETPAGELCALVSADPDNPAVGIYLIPKDGDGTIIDLAYAEVKGEELMEIHNEREREKLTAEDVCLYTYADPYTEDYTQRNIIKRDDVVKALELDTDNEKGTITMENVNYKEISDCISKLQISLSDEKFRKETPWIKEDNCSVISYNASNGNGMSHFRIDLREGSVDVSSGNGGYVLTSNGKDGVAMSEDTLFAVAKAVKDATEKECYPCSGEEPWSWKGILTDEHIAELEDMGKADKKTKADVERD